jgi:hypothetical protein
VATGDTLEEVEREMRAAIAFHLEGLDADGEPIPDPSGPGVYIERATAVAQVSRRPPAVPRSPRLNPAIKIFHPRRTRCERRRFRAFPTQFVNVRVAYGLQEEGGLSAAFKKSL